MSSLHAAFDGPLRGLRILIVEDSHDNRRLLTNYLRRAGAEVAFAENGRDAVDGLMKESGGPGSPQPDVVLMDLQMPVVNGYDATRELRVRGYDGQIVALTANALIGDEQVCQSCGCDDYATKPISSEELTVVVRRAIDRQAAFASPARHAA
ncbi:MAG: response regulator [Planctomycetota bacterium]